MLFNELAFLIFFPIVTILHFLIPHRFRWSLLLAASYFFYMWWKIEYAVLVLVSTGIDYFAGLRMGALKEKKARRKYLYLSLAGNFALLFSFKYFNFFSHSLNQLFAWLDNPYSIPHLDLLLPVGISFYTFQTLSYTFEVYRGEIEPERHFGRFALYVSFFPQLVAGPIERARNLLPQIDQLKRLDYRRIAEGSFLILWGMFKKVVVADRLATGVNHIYGNPGAFDGPELLLATMMFACQIYCDFSGYSDIAVGSARILGFDLMYNFHSPYLAASISDFWKRWHISLSTWFRDYLYIPLGGSQVRLRRWNFNILVVFTVSGLWHGANWTFIIWGFLHGLYYLTQAAYSRFSESVRRATGLDRKPGLYNLLCILITFSAVNLAWIFFRANSLTDAMLVISRLPSGWNNLFNPVFFQTLQGHLGMGSINILVALFSVLSIAVIERLIQRQDLEIGIMRLPFGIRWPLYLALTLAILHLGIIERVPFIYFAF